MKTLAYILVLFLITGCTIRLCNCNTGEVNTESLDGNGSTNIEMELSPR